MMAKVYCHCTIFKRTPMNTTGCPEKVSYRNQSGQWSGGPFQIRAAASDRVFGP